MVKKIVYGSDLSGDDGAKTFFFSVGGRAYEVDLTPDEITKFESLVAPYVTVARPVGKSREVESRTKLSLAGATSKQVREWAVAKGLKVSDRGRIPAEIIEEYIRSH